MLKVPNRSSGNPVVPLYRVPAPGSQPKGKYYEDPYSLPAGDIQGNTYFKRDARRNYPKISAFDQTRVSGLLKLGTSTDPRISIGNTGEKELQVFKEPEAKIYLSSSLKAADDQIIQKQILGQYGVVVAPSLNLSKKSQVRIVKGDHGMYPESYPCRIFNYY